MTGGDKEGDLKLHSLTPPSSSLPLSLCTSLLLYLPPSLSLPLPISLSSSLPLSLSLSLNNLPSHSSRKSQCIISLVYRHLRRFLLNLSLPSFQHILQ